MPAREHAERPGPAARSRAATPVDPARRLSPRDLLALQRSMGNAVVSRLLDSEEQADEHTPAQRPSVESVLSGPGTPLPATVRAEMESRLDADFSSVRLHTGLAARDSASGIGARAYTSGDHVVIGDGGADPHTLAHELTHVIQQRSGPVAGTDNGSGLSISDPADRFEQEAEANAHRALSGPAPEQRAAEEPEGTLGEGPGPVPVQRVRNETGEPASEPSKSITAGKNFKAHFLRHKALLQEVTGNRYKTLAEGGPLFLADLAAMIEKGDLRFEGMGTLKKDQPEARIYRGKGLTLVTTVDHEFWTILKSGQALDKAIVMSEGR